MYISLWVSWKHKKIVSKTNQTLKSNKFKQMKKTTFLLAEWLTRIK